MAYLYEQPIVSLADTFQAQTFIADISQPRPGVDEIASFCGACNAEGIEKFKAAMMRKNCAVSWVQLVIDQHGVLAIVRYKHPLILGDAKKAASVVLRCLPDKQRRAVEQGLRPLDEVDRDRISAWTTVESLHRKRKRTEEDEEEEEDEADTEVYFVPNKRVRTEEERAEPPKKTAQELLKEFSDSDSEDSAAPVPRLMLTDAAAVPSTLACPDLFDPDSLWGCRMKEEATIILAEAGARPDQLTYIKCHHEDRRQRLLQGRVKREYDKPTLLSVVRVAMKLAMDGKIPGIGKHGRRSEFMERCAEALKAINPEAERDVKKLNADQQTLIRHALGGDSSTPDEGCFSADCLDKEAVWETTDNALPGEPSAQISRCARCKYHKAIGRSVNSLRDILLPSMKQRRNYDVAHSSSFLRLVRTEYIPVRGRATHRVHCTST